MGTFRALLWGISEALEASRRAKMAQAVLECMHAVPSRPRRFDRVAIKREIRENRERGREEDHMF